MIYYHRGRRGQTGLVQGSGAQAMQMKSYSFETMPNVFWHSSLSDLDRSPQQYHGVVLVLVFLRQGRFSLKLLFS